MADPDYFVEIKDFSPGIFSDYHATDNSTTDSTYKADLRGALPIKNGAATVENTFDCHADKVGALTPLPKMLAGKTNVLLPNGNAGGNTAAYLLDARADSRVKTGFETTNALTVYGYRIVDPAIGNNRMYVQGVFFRSGIATTALFFVKAEGVWVTVGENASQSSGIPSAVINVGDAADDPATTIFRQYIFSVGLRPPDSGGSAGTNDWVYGTVTAAELAWSQVVVTNQWGTGASQYAPGYKNVSATLSKGYIVCLMRGWGFSNASVDFYTDRYPVVTAGFINQTYPVINAIFHQNRLIIATAEDNAGLILEPTTGDVYWYSNLRKPTEWKTNALARSQHTKATFTPDNMTPGSIFGSVAADQLLIVKSYGGGVLVQGDVSFPTVRKMPYIQSTGGVYSVGISCPIGFVYGSRDGVYLWAGGDTTQKLSRQLDGYFWDHTQGDAANEYYNGNRARFGFWNGFVLVPNNYWYEIEKDAWWRVSGVSGTPFNVYDVNTHNVLQAFPYKLTATQNVVWNIYRTEQQSDTYSWQSQPLIETRGRRLKFQDIRVLATHKGGSSATVTVTLTGFSQDGTQLASQATAFTLPANAEGGHPQLLRKDLTPNFQAEYVQVRIEANANNTADAAPKIHKVSLGVKDGAKTIRTS